jgi:hypothetical protein
VREIPGVLATLVPPRDVRGLTSVLREKLQSLTAGPSYGHDYQTLTIHDQMRQQFDMGRMVRETWEVYHNFLRN